MLAFAAPILAREGVKAGIKWAKVLIPLLVLLGLAIWIAVLKGEVRHLTKERDGLKSWQTATVNVVAAEVPPERRPHVTASEAANEIRWLAREYRTHKQALDEQSAKLRVAAGKATDAQNDAEARKRATQREKEVEAIRRGLRDPARSTGLTEAEWGKL
jgi:glutamate/tyrosine decarboxylase-like PLP-dependent enzyme